MLKEKIFINKFRFNLIIITFIFILSKISCQFNYNKEDGNNCTVNLQCNSGCCKSGICSNTKKCIRIIKIIYKSEAIACALLIIFFSIYLMYKLVNLKKNFYKNINENVKGKYCILF